MNAETKNYIIILVIFSFAFFSRLYRLGDFPYFIPDYPWVGEGSGELKGLYTDEYWNYLYATDLISNPLNPPIKSAIYQPWLQLLTIGASVLVFGSNSFAVRLPSAIFSAISVVLVYLICVKKFRSRFAACLSALYLIVMTPAFILNRMAFLENGAVLFFLASYYSLLVYNSEQKRERWVVVSAIFAGLSVLCKINGLTTLLFFFFYLMYSKNFIRNLRSIMVVLTIVSAFPIIILVSYNLGPIELMNNFLKQWEVGIIGREFQIWHFMLFNTMPSGYITWWGDYLRLEYWYIFAYFALAYVTAKEHEKTQDVILAITAFLILHLFAGSIGAYYLIIIHPFLAISVGYALTKLNQMPTPTAMFFYIFLYAPAILTADIYLVDKVGNPILTNDQYAIALKTITLLLPPLLILAPTMFKNRFPKKSKVVATTIIIAVFLIFLFIGSYIIPIFYPHYLQPPT